MNDWGGWEILDLPPYIGRLVLRGGTFVIRQAGARARVSNTVSQPMNVLCSSGEPQQWGQKPISSGRKKPWVKKIVCSQDGSS